MRDYFKGIGLDLIFSIDEVDPLKCQWLLQTNHCVWFHAYTRISIWAQWLDYVTRLLGIQRRLRNLHRRYRAANANERSKMRACAEEYFRTMRLEPSADLCIFGPIGRITSDNLPRDWQKKIETMDPVRKGSPCLWEGTKRF
ncbi:hypothetical protein [Lysobacter enzymogenes]|uniref:hypothetical protein n=1 Tax=Lysobacter enzymogenes TaxID=69 RepID=UPI00226503A9|nr:hypothetical protein [Lysobacter enzymogenes]UZW62845.1 hypothetical protein BV903_011340 [Lysobacter enzymogenes]